LDLLIEDAHGAWIGDLVRSQVEPFGVVDGVRITATGAPFFVHADAAQSVGLALYELATNASKHGALSVPGGMVSIRWEIESDVGEPTFRLLWVERNGPTVTPPTHQGFGTVVLQRMAGQAMHGKVDHRYDPQGVSWTLEVPTSTVEGIRLSPRLRPSARQPSEYIPRLVRTLEQVLV
jgi:two-component sensor histidine kinase